MRRRPQDRQGEPDDHSGWQPPAPKSRPDPWVTIAAGLIAALIGVAKVAEAFILPGCDSSRSLGAVRSIFKDKNLPEPALTDPSRSPARRPRKPVRRTTRCPMRRASSIIGSIGTAGAPR